MGVLAAADVGLAAGLAEDASQAAAVALAQEISVLNRVRLHDRQDRLLLVLVSIIALKCAKTL